MALLRWAVLLALSAGSVGWFLTSPKSLSSEQLTALNRTADATAGEQVFWAAGCASCHTAPGAAPSDRPVLAGGQAFKTEFGTFYAPNVSSSPQAGIGAWSLEEFANAVLNGVSPGNAHYFPAFPYTSYTKMTPEDVSTLYAFMATLPADETASQAHDVGFPFNIRRSVGGWKLLFGGGEWVVADAATPELERGRYLVEALAHCSECHTSRNPLGGLNRDQWLTGAANPNGKGRIPGITTAQLEWSDTDLAYYLTTGFTPDFDSAGGQMAEVVANMARLPEEDIAAIVAYLRVLP